MATKTKRIRDMQRFKVYAAEGVCSWYREDPFPDFESLVRYVKVTICGSTWFQRTFDHRHINVDKKHSGSAEAIFGWNLIRFPSRQLYRAIVLHEVAHLVTPHDAPIHGREFCCNFLLLVRHFLGREKHDQLKAAMKAHRVKFRKKRVSTNRTGNLDALRRWREEQKSVDITNVQVRCDQPEPVTDG